ncbi:MAG: hypothetical protein Kow0074_13140 [Candidatus Zixiibacteriota bacterium]
MSCTHVMVQRACRTLSHVVPVTMIAIFCAVTLQPVSVSAQDVWGPPDDPYVPEVRSDLSSSTGDDDDSSQKAGFPQTIDSVNISSIDPSNFPEICTFVEVLDENGDPIPNLDLDSFCVFQDEQKIDSFSVVELQDQCATSIALVLDVSGSMLFEGKIDSLKSAAHQFVNQMDVYDRVAIVTFSSCYNIVQTFTSDKALLHSKINTLNASGRTAALDGIWAGVDLTKSEIGSRAVIALSDGMENNSRFCDGYSDGLLDGFTDDSISICNLALNSGVPIYTIALGSTFDPQYLKGLANGSGGSYYFAPTGAEISGIYSQIKFRVCSRYLICYQSPDTLRNGDCHNVRICRLDPSGFCQPCDTATYCEPSPPEIVIDPGCQRWEQDAYLCASVIDADTPPESLVVRLFYRNDNGPYNDVSMVWQGGSDFCATIPASFFPCGGDPVEYYITAYDGVLAVSFPAGAPQNAADLAICPNTPPVCQVPNDTTISLCDLTEVCLPVGCSDADGNLMNGYPQISGKGTYSNGNWCYTPAGDEVVDVLVTCVDSCGAGCESGFTVTFEVNEAPRCNFSWPSDTTIFQCQPTQVCIPYFSNDADGNIDSCRVTMDDGTKLSPQGDAICYTPKGDETVTFTIRCWDDCGEMCESSITVTFDINEGPLCNVPNDTTIFQCVPTEVCWPHAPTDPDGNLVDCEWWIAGDDAKSSLTQGLCVTPKGSGPLDIVIRCVDACDVACEDTFRVDFVLNESPVCGRGYDTTIELCSSEEICLPVGCEDVNLSSGPTLISGPGAILDGRWCYTPSKNETVDFAYVCMDSCGVACTTSSVIDFTVNQPPTCDLPNDTLVFLCEPTEVCWEYSFGDPDGNLDSCNVYALTDPSKGLGGSICITPEKDTTYSFVLECWDACGEYCTDTFTVTFDLNEDPVCGLPNDTTIYLCEPTEVCLDYFPTDPDNNLRGCEQWSSVDPSRKDGPVGYSFCYTPTKSEQVIFYAACIDECGAQCVDSVVVDFVLNRDPVCQYDSYDTTIALCSSEEVCLPVGCTDDNLASGPTLISGPGAIVNGFWCYTPTRDTTIEFAWNCVDSCGAECSGGGIIDFDINEAPVCSALVPLSPPLCLPDTHVIPIRTIDGDGDIVTCENTNPNASFENGLWSYSPAPGERVIDTVRCVDSCGEFCELYIDITFPTPQPPVCLLPGDTTVVFCDLGEEICLPATATGGATCEVTSGPGSVENGFWCFTPVQPGEYEVTIECRTECDSCSGSFTVTVEANSPPVVECSLDVTDHWAVLPVLGNQSPPPYFLRLDGFLDGDPAHEVIWSPIKIWWVEYGDSAHMYGTMEIVEFDGNPVAGGNYEQTWALNAWFDKTTGPNPEYTYYQLRAVDSPEMWNVDAPSDVGYLWHYGDPFQVGDGANDKNDHYGASGWLNFVHDSAGTVYGDSTVHWTASDFLLDLIPCFTFCEADEFCIDYFASDPDGDSLVIFSNLGDPDSSGVCFLPDTSGIYTFIIGAIDDCQETAVDTCVFCIEINEPPVITCPDDIRVACDQLVYDTGEPSVSDENPATVEVTRVTDSIPGDCPQEWTLAISWIATDECGLADTCVQNIYHYDDTPPEIACEDCGDVETQIGYPIFDPESEKRDSAPCASLTESGNFEIVFDSVVYNNPAGTSTWYYRVRWNGTPPALSHLTLGLCGTIGGDNVIGSVPPHTIVGRDGSTGVYGIKWDSGEPVIQTFPANQWVGFQFTLNEQYEVGEAQVVAKAGQQEEIVGVCGASCNQRNGCIRVISCDEALDLTPPELVDNCDPEPTIKIISRDSIPGNCPQSYELAVVWEAKDACGNTSTCERIYRVVDEEPPTITCPPDTIISCLETNRDTDLFNGGRPLGDPVVVDNCDPEPIWESDFEMVSDDPCSTVWKFSFWAYDACENYSDTCYQYVTVVDSTAPELICPPDTVIACDAFEIDPPELRAIPEWPYGEPQVRDDCDLEPMKMLATIDFVSEDPCSTIVKLGYLAWDRCNNYSDTCFQYVRVVDTVAPVVTCPPDTTIDCTLEINGSFGWATAEDNCDEEPRVDVVRIDTVFADIGEGCDFTIRRWFAATDTCGNTSEECYQAITVVDTTAPICNLPSDTSFFLCEKTEICLPVSASDRCDVDVECRVADGYGAVVGDQWCFVPDTSGVYPVIIVCEDECGNQCRGEFTVTVRLNHPPTVEAPPDTSYFLCDRGDTICVGPFPEFDVDGNQDYNTVPFGWMDPPFVCFVPDTAGTYEVICCTVDSCGAIGCDTTYVTVNFNTPPVCHPPNDTTIFLCEPEEVCLPYSCSDIDGNLMIVDPFKGDFGVEKDTFWCYVPKRNETLKLTVLCVDSCGAECRTEFLVTFILNEAPTCEVPNDTTIFLCDTNEVSLPVGGFDINENFLDCRVLSGPGDIANGFWTYTPQGEDSSVVVVECIDSCEASCVDSFVVHWDYNLPPVCEFDEFAPPQCVPEQLVVPISSTDPEGGPVTCEVVEGPGELNGNVWLWEPIPGVDTSVVIRCTDTCGAYCELSFRVLIPDPQPPICQVPVEDQEFFFCEPELISIPIKAVSGVEGLVTCEVVSGPGEINDTLWTYLPKGSESFDVTVRCTDICGAFCEETFRVNVTINTPPQCTMPEDRQFFQCTPTAVQLPFTSTDVDGNFSHCEVWSGPGKILGSNWVYTPQGSETVVVTIRCWDECEEYCEGTFTVRFDIDEEPICNVPNDTTITLCQPTRVMLPVTADFFRPDDDASNLGDIGGSNNPATRKTTDQGRGTRYGKETYNPRDDRNSNFAAGGLGDEFCEIVSGPGQLANGYWVYTPSGDEVVNVVIRCTDQCGYTCEDDFTVTFDVNEPPECDFQAPAPSQCIPPVVVVPFESTDPDGDPLDCELIEGQGSLVDGAWQYNPVGGESFDVVIRCTDTCGASCEIEFTYTAPNPQPPVCVVPTEDVEVFLCGPQTISAPVSATGGEGEVTCAVTNGKGSISNGQWSFNATKSERFEVEVECTDVCGNTCVSSFFVDVTINSAPVCNIPDDQYFWDCEEVNISLPVSATDVDGGSVGCAVVDGPGQIIGGNYVWSTTQQGVYDVTIACFDDCEAACEETFTITVDINDAPVCNISDQEFSGCDILSASVPLNPSDEDGNFRRCKLISGPGAIVDGNWVFNTTITGEYDITIECSDSCGATSVCTFTATFEANSAPVCEFGDTTIVVCGPSTTVYMPLPVDDPNGNFVGCTLISGPGSIEGNEWVYHLLEDTPVDLVIRCEDECGMFCEKSFTVSFEYGDVNPCDFMTEEIVYVCGPGEFCLDIPPGCTATFGQGVQGTVDGIDLCFLVTEEGRYWANISCQDDCGNVCSDTAYFQVVFDPTLPTCGPGAASTKDGSRMDVQAAGFDPCDCPVRGDIDGDGDITSTDLSLLGRFLAKEALIFSGTEHCPLETRADVNCDGKIDMADVDDLRLYLYFNGAEPCGDCTGR